MIYKMLHVDSVDMLHECHDSIEPYLDKLLEDYPDYDKVSFFEAVLKGEVILFLITCDTVKGFVTLKIKQYPNTQVLVIDMLCGDDMKSWVEDVNSQIEEIGRASSCERVEFTGRKGWLPVMKQLGYSNESIYMLKEL